MGKRSSKKKNRDHDFSVTAFRVVQEATGQAASRKEANAPTASVDRHAAAVELGRLGGLKGGKALANPYPRTPAMATGLTDHVWTVDEFVRLVKQ